MRWLSILSCVALSMALNSANAQDAVPKKVSWAHIEVKGAYPEGAQMPGLFSELSESMDALVKRIRKAADDKAVDGIVLRINSPSIGWGRMNELKQVIDYAKTKRKVIAQLDDANTRDFLLAACCDQIIMPESSNIMLLGMRAEVSFYKNLFDKLNVKPDMLRVGEYKSAAEPYNRTEMSPAFREEMEAIIGDYFDQMVEQVATRRQLPKNKVIQIIDNGPYTAADAKRLGLIDHVAYTDQISAMLKTQSDVHQDIRMVKRYGKKDVDMDFSGPFGPLNMLSMMMGGGASSRRSSKPKVAVIYATGMIMTGRSQSSPLGGNTLGSDSLVAAINKAAKDKTVKAIVLRVDSPGGSALASDLIWRALENAPQPFVASMGDTAASGGYYISMGADSIFAEPGTLTGSIGVVGGKVALGGLMEKVGVTTSVISRGKNSGMFSMNDSFSDTERTAIQKLLQNTYEQFTRKAAAGRKMDYDTLEKLARGRVYTGRQALKLGLIDKLGTLEDAIDHAESLAGVDAGESLERMVLPKAVSPLEMLLGPKGAEARANNVAKSVLNELPEVLSDQLERLSALRLLSAEPSLTLMPFEVKVK